MMTYIDDLSDIASVESLRADAELTSSHTITVSTDGVDHARLISRSVRAAEQWQVYQNAIALLGLQQWLAERGINITASVANSSLFDEAIAGLLTGVCKLHIGQFKVCLLPMGSLTDEYIAVPRAALELADYVPHLFIGIEVREELNQVTFWGSLRLDTLRQEIQTNPVLAVDDNWTYRIPQQWFHPDPNTALLYLRCLAADSIPLSTIFPAPQANPAAIQANLPILRPRIQTSQRPLWRLLPWNQAIALFQQPSLAKALLQPDTHQTRPNLSSTAMNVGEWLQGQLDELAQALNWTLLPALSPAVQTPSPFRQIRPSVEQLEEVLNSLHTQGITVPSQARGGYLDMPIGTQLVRLQAIIWDSSEDIHQPEWTLLIILGATPDRPHPSTMTLTIRDDYQALDQQTLDASTPASYLFTAVSGTWDEQFWITIEVNNGASVTLPPFTFQPSHR